MTGTEFFDRLLRRLALLVITHERSQAGKIHITPFSVARSFPSWTARSSAPRFVMGNSGPSGAMSRSQYERIIRRQQLGYFKATAA